MWGKQVYRLSDLDFEANAKEGIAVDWPIRYKDIAPWYDKVEMFIGVSGQKAGLPQLPDGMFQPPMEMNCIEKEVAKKLKVGYVAEGPDAGLKAMLETPVFNFELIELEDTTGLRGHIPDSLDVARSNQLSAHSKCCLYS